MKNTDIAGALTVSGKSDPGPAFERLRQLTDYTIILDHGSGRSVPFKRQCGEYLQLETKTRDPSADKVLLMYRAFLNGCKWVVYLEDDLVFSANFSTKKHVADITEKLVREGHDTGCFKLRYLWNSVKEYRCDGEWDRKTYGVIRRNWFFDPKISLPSMDASHRQSVFPANRNESSCLIDDHVTYHAAFALHFKKQPPPVQQKGLDPDLIGQWDCLDAIRTAPVPDQDRAVVKIPEGS